jgi:hypothetical protein
MDSNETMEKEWNENVLQPLLTDYCLNGAPVPMKAIEFVHDFSHVLHDGQLPDPAQTSAPLHQHEIGVDRSSNGDASTTAKTKPR